MVIPNRMRGATSVEDLCGGRLALVVWRWVVWGARLGKVVVVGALCKHPLIGYLVVVVECRVVERDGRGSRGLTSS